MSNAPQYYVKLHFEAYAGATGNPSDPFDIEATGKAAQLYGSIEALCAALAVGAKDSLSDLDFEEPAQVPEA